jgi:predicted transcriptional regulator
MISKRKNKIERIKNWFYAVDNASKELLVPKVASPKAKEVIKQINSLQTPEESYRVATEKERKKAEKLSYKILQESEIYSLYLEVTKNQTSLGLKLDEIADEIENYVAGLEDFDEYKSKHD